MPCMRVDGMFHDGEAQARAAVTAAARAIDRIKTFENAFLIFRGNAHAGVGNFDNEMFRNHRVLVAAYPLFRRVGGRLTAAGRNGRLAILPIGADGDSSFRRRRRGGLGGVVEEIFQHQRQ